MQALSLGGATLTLTTEEPTPVRLDEQRPSLWDYSSSEPDPISPPPSPDILAKLSAIAETDYRLSSYIESASELTIPAEQLVAAAFHAPAPRLTHISPAEWIFRFQVAALLALASSERAWHGSARRQSLYDIASGHVDWLSAAAMIALGVVAVSQSDATSEIESWFAKWLLASPSDAPYGYEPYLIASWMRLPHLGGETESLLWRRRRAACSR
jgi:hypothetical protein